MTAGLAASRDKHYQQKLTQFPSVYQALAHGRASWRHIRSLLHILRSRSAEQRPLGPRDHAPRDSAVRNRRHHCRLYLFHLSASLASVVAPVVHAAAPTVEATSGCVTHMSITTGRPGKNTSKSFRWGLRWLRGGSCGVCCIGRGGGGCGCCCRCCAGCFFDIVRGSEDCAVTDGYDVRAGSGWEGWCEHGCHGGSEARAHLGLSWRVCSCQRSVSALVFPRERGGSEDRPCF